MVNKSATRDSVCHNSLTLVTITTTTITRYLVDSTTHLVSQQLWTLSPPHCLTNQVMDKLHANT